MTPILWKKNGSSCVQDLQKHWRVRAHHNPQRSFWWPRAWNIRAGTPISPHLFWVFEGRFWYPPHDDTFPQDSRLRIFRHFLHETEIFTFIPYFLLKYRRNQVSKWELPKLLRSLNKKSIPITESPNSFRFGDFVVPSPGRLELCLETSHNVAGIMVIMDIVRSMCVPYSDSMS